jgi:hypothetical protein
MKKYPRPNWTCEYCHTSNIHGKQNKKDSIPLCPTCFNLQRSDKKQSKRNSEEEYEPNDFPKMKRKYSKNPEGFSNKKAR